MKKLLLSIIISLSVGFSNFSFGQISGYGFAQAAGTPTLLTATYTTHTSGTTDYGVYTAVPIGFTFQYNCVNYTTVSISNDGYIVMGNSLSNTYTPLSTGSDNNVISALAADLQGVAAGSSLRSKTVGAVGSRTFTVEWKNYKEYWDGGDFTFQIILYETSNNIVIRYTTTTALTAASDFQTGLRGASNADFNNRTKAGGANWIASTAGASNSDLMSCNTPIGRNPTGVFTWTPAAACAGVPAAGTATPSPASVCSGSTSTITLTGYTAGCGISYQWQSSPDNSIWSNIGGATSTSYVATVSALTYYRCITTCSNGGGTATSSVATVTINAPTSCYCVSSATSTSDMDITNITLGTINNTSATVSLTGTQGNAAGTAGMYSDWRASAVPVPSLQQGSTTAFSVTIGGTAYSHRVDVYIDFNQDGDFADAGESLPIFAYANPALPNTTASSINIPITATTGVTTMRVVCVESSTTSECGTYTWGETEDYRINITAAPACSGAPTPGTTVSSVNPICPGGTTVLSVTGSSVASGLVYQWQSSPDNATWTNVAGETGLTYTVSPTSNTYYRRVITCTLSGGLSSNSVSVYETIVLTAACYCASAATSTSDMDILRVTYGTINNTTANISLTGTQGNATGTAGMYSNWTASAVPVPNIQQNVATAFTVQIGGGSPYSHRVDVYIDLNQDGDFVDVGENFPIFAYANPALPNTTTVNITIPCSSTLGQTTMRVVCVESSSSSACGTYTWGETEDYKINITAGGACAGTPVAGTAVASVATISSCASPTSIVSLTGASTSCGINYQWQSAPAAAGPWTNISGATSSFYISSPASNTYYRCILTCTISGLSATSSSVLVSVTISIPPNNDCSGATTLTVNANQSCGVVTSGTVNCSSASSDPNTCWGTADDDVWFKFVATSGSHDITLSNVAGSTTDLYHSVYSGTCGVLGTPLVCSDPNTSTVSGLTIGNTYYVRVYTYTSTSGQTTTFDICIGSLPNCATPPNCNLNYTLSSIAHAPVSYATGTVVSFSDDRFASSYTALGFNFCFDGITYTDVLISSNGYLIFPSCYSAAPTETSITTGGYSPYTIDGPVIPNTTDAPRNAILAPWQDIDPAAGGTTRYATIGSAPNRIFIVKYDNIAMYSCTSSKFSGQVMLYETTNNIEVHITEKTVCASWNGGDAILGLHNYDGTIAVTNAAHNYPNNWAETNTAYRFTSNCGAACSSLPIKLISFNAESIKDFNLLKWSTSTEINNDYFVIEVSTNMNDFIDIAHVNGAGNSNVELNYQFKDYSPLTDIMYYRLRQVDFDGKWSYSNIVAVKKINEGDVSIYPNPAKESLFIDVNSIIDETYTINYINILGSVRKESIEIIEGTKTYQTNEFKNLTPGIYFIQVVDANNEVIKYQKIVKE